LEMSMESHLVCQVFDPSHPGEVRREAMAFASRVGFAAADAGRVALVVTEMATNIVKHAGKGQILLRAMHEIPGSIGVEVLALDQGSGMSDVSRCMQDGYSTAGSPGTGLGAISRLATLMDIYSMPEKGTALLARVLPLGMKQNPTDSPFSIGAVRVACPGETACGDDWSVKLGQERAAVIVADGLGHGPEAAKAAAAAVRIFDAAHQMALPDLFQRLHGGLQATRGAAISIAELDLVAGEVRFAGVGNVAGFLAWPGGSRNMVTHNGTIGAQFNRANVLQYGWTKGASLVLYTDGLNSHTSIDAYPGLLARHPSLVAGVLYRDFVRGRDDATVVVITERREATRER
jgi:anti-sigma regulatory factor (Ser/Thr protein kinase)